ncbi:molybdate ABC transporter, ATP-binding protein [Leptospira inadai serovar Lyme str. 10]|uniref:Molybdate ABC transporter, ATP-binding protein n=2 Tax=Leptospira inadai serovar Lyme TaxID=293084 RepID=V6HA03_9LEPT|nr:molybdenum ABC transporter ATP-binding protein [Leptospira inadai]EQA35892.1 molybdate ABC transporter, ATP-binding protein [Leptospira inadai serovar Lyme str. 10]PNV76826.1 molybdenum ABC transporter ATP-binding protein [Leptospira inadai serovar Lyme]
MNEIVIRLLLDRERFALNVDLNLPERGVTGLFGSSGSGKTTLLRCIAGLENTTRGFLSVGGTIWQNDNYSLPTHKRQLGYVFQEPSLFPHLSVSGNLSYGLKRTKCDRQINLNQTIELLGIEHLLERKTDNLSGGERQRVAIARALVTSPRLLLMDEPMASLDKKRKQEILPYLERLNQELKIPVLYVSHSLDEIVRLADHIIIMEDGKVTATGPVSETLARADLARRLSEDIGVIVDATVGEIDEDWHLARLDFPDGNLWILDRGFSLGSRMRIRIFARDIILFREGSKEFNTRNILNGKVDAIVESDHPGLFLVHLRLGQTILIAKVTALESRKLGISVGDPVPFRVNAMTNLMDL